MAQPQAPMNNIDRKSSTKAAAQAMPIPIPALAEVGKPLNPPFLLVVADVAHGEGAAQVVGKTVWTTSKVNVAVVVVIAVRVIEATVSVEKTVTVGVVKAFAC